MKKQLLMLTAFLKGRVVLLRERSHTENWSKNIGHN
jgi:hypothetical protein